VVGYILPGKKDIASAWLFTPFSCLILGYHNPQKVIEMATHKIYGYCLSCYEGIISVIKSDKVDNTKTLYQCPKCGCNTEFNFANSKIIEQRIKAKKDSE